MGGKDAMMNQHFTYQDVLNHSKDFVHALMNRDIIMFQYLLDDDFLSGLVIIRTNISVVKKPLSMY